MNIAIIPNRGFGSDGISSYIMTNCHFFDFKKNHYILIYSRINGKSGDAAMLTKEIQHLGGSVYYIDKQNIGLKAYIKSLGEILRNEQIDIVHIHGSSASIALEEWIAKRNHVKNIIVHSHSTHSGHSTIHRFLRPIATMWANKHLACGDLAGKWMYGNHSFRIMPNAIDTDRYYFNSIKREKLRSEFNIPCESIVLGNVGSLQNGKNQQFLLKLMQDNKELSLFLLLIGQGENKHLLSQMAKDYGIEDKVRFLGQRNDVPDLLNALDIFVLPSFFEGFPIVAVEAQASGLHCLLSDKISQEVQLTDLVQYLPISDTSLWLNAISKIRYKKVEREKYKDIIASKGFDVKTAAKDLEKVYELGAI